MPILKYTVDVGWTNTRPVVPEQHTSRVTVMAESATEAELTAMSMVGARTPPPGFAPCEMPTSSTIVDWEE